MMMTSTATLTDSDPSSTPLCHLTVEEEAEFAERDGIPRWMFYREMAIHEREAAVQAFLKAIPGMVFLLDSAGTFLDFKKSKDLEWLAPGSRFLRKTLYEILPPAIAQPFMYQVAQVFLTGQLHVFEYQLTLSGRLREFEVRLMQATPYEVVAVTQDVTEHKHMLRQLQALSRQLLNAQEQERSSLSRDLHDEIGQDVTALILAVHQTQVGSTGSAQRDLMEVETALQALARKVRHLAQDLRPATLDELGLTVALNGLLMRYVQQTALHLKWHVPDGLPRFSPEIEIAAYRIVQEALTNVVRHAQARCVKIDVRQAGDRLLLQIVDDGQGFDVSATSQADRFGLLSMSERAILLGGKICIRSTPGQGTQINAELPTDEPPERNALP